VELALIRLLFSFIISFLLTLYLIPFFSAIATKLNILDVPDGVIKMHKKSTPYLGGVAIYLGFIATLALIFPFENKILSLLLGATLLLFVGLVDDILRIKPYQKFFWQMIAASCFLKSGLHLKENFFLAHFWNIPISFLWIVSVINAFNLVDVMDGLAVTIASCASATFLIIAIAYGQYSLALLLASFLGPLLAFFWYNKPPAQIYLGDAGSLFIGGFLATIPFLFKWSTYNSYGFFTPVIVLTIPILEISALVLIRSYKKIPFYNASPDHFSIYLQQNGWRKSQILAYVLFVSAFLLILSLLLFFNKINLPILAIAFLTLIIFWILSISPKAISS
jgi:UDP-GlcNAc:undecaprenyl-phosphate/decaprenyl-phosphate GlcNAc-1-phosphate transferase